MIVEPVVEEQKLKTEITSISMLYARTKPEITKGVGNIDINFLLETIILREYTI